MALRKNQSTLSAAEKKAFVDALIALKHAPSKRAPATASRYDDYVQTHMDAMQPGVSWAHGGPAFLPWHREFLRRLELDLQTTAGNANIGIPYWDWTVNRTATSSPWTPDLMGGNGRASDGRVMTGPFAFDNGNWPLSITALPGVGTDLRRRLSAIGLSLPSASQVNGALQTVPYDVYPWSFVSMPSFRNRLEGNYGAGNIHNRVHNWVGGAMRGPASPNDPVFWLHHANLDRLWVQWRRLHPAEEYQPIGGARAGQNLNDPMQPWGGATTPASVLDHFALGYRYDTDP